MNQDNSRQRAGSDVDKRSEPSENGGVSKLKYRTKNSCADGGEWVGEFEFIEMVDMGYPEI